MGEQHVLVFDLCNALGWHVIELKQKQKKLISHVHQAAAQLWAHTIKTISVLNACGSVLRQAGQTFDRIGLSLQGKSAVHETLSKHRVVRASYNNKPWIGENTWIAPSATVVGKPTIGKGSAIWYGSVIRGDTQDNVTIGDSVTILDRAIVSLASGLDKTQDTVIHNNVTIESGALVNRCILENGSWIEAGAHVAQGAIVGAQSVIGAKSYVAPGTVVPTKQYWAGSPAVFVRDLSAQELTAIEAAALRHLERAEQHAYWHELTPTEKSLVIDRATTGGKDVYRPEHLF